jgi:hypothetical protein
VYCYINPFVSYGWSVCMVPDAKSCKDPTLLSLSLHLHPIDPQPQP